MPNTFQSLQEQLSERGGVMLKNGEQLNPRNLIPFYVSFGQHCYQCFWKEWFEESEIGNVYYSGIEHSLSEPQQGQDADINMAFPTFLGWLMFYLEGIGC